jgi:trimethylamine---corrinoid protein Co-methyltransferase
METGMKTQIQVLSDPECVQMHERSLKQLSTSGVRVMSERGRLYLKEAGAEVKPSSDIVRFPRALIEESLKLAPKKFSLGARRPGWSLEMNAGECTLLADGGAVSVLDTKKGETRPGTYADWLTATHLIDAMDEIGIYWNMIEQSANDRCTGDLVAYWHNLLANCSKHIQDSTDSPGSSKILLEILQIAFGTQETIRSRHPYSHLLCPMSPMVIDQQYTDAYLELIGYDIPVAIMPMPLMGATGPASLISTVLTANCETLAMLCLVQAAAPNTPVLYAPAPQTIEPHSWRYTGGAVENSLFGAAVIEMGRHYGLPVEAPAGGTDQFAPGAQASYERAINWALPCLGWPDILVGPGLLGGATILCFEQMVMDVEVFRRLTRLHQGIDSAPEQWLETCITETGPGGNFLKQKSTLKAIREGAWYSSEVGFHDTYSKWKAAGMPDALDNSAEIIKKILNDHHPLPLDPEAERELKDLERKVRESDHPSTRQ